MQLQHIQHAFQDHVLRGDAAIAGLVRDSGTLGVPERLAIYTHAYSSRLTEALREGFPALARTVGDEAFARLARSYIEERPSVFASIRWFGHALPEHLDARAVDDHGAMLGDLARWEWTLAAAFDGADEAAVGLEAAATVPAQDWPHLRVRLHGNLQRTATTTNAIEFWRAATAGAGQPALALHTKPIEWIAWRRDLATSFRSLDAGECLALDAAGRGQAFGELCAGLAVRVGDEAAPLHAVTFLKQWLADGWVAGLSVEPA